MVVRLKQSKRTSNQENKIMNNLNPSQNLAARRCVGCFERAHVFRENHPRILSPSVTERSGIPSFTSHPRAIKTTWPILLGLLLLAAPAAVQAQDAYSTNADGSIYTYSTNADGSANIVAYAGPPWVVTIPTNINGLTVTSIGLGEDAAFLGNGESPTFPFDLTSVTIPGCVTSIERQAFYDCENLSSVTIPNSVTNIGFQAFTYCTGLTNATIGNSVTSIGQQAFFTCVSLTSVTIGNSVTVIGGSAFQGCPSLSSVTIPNSVTIGTYAFSECSSLTNITIPDSVIIDGGAFRLCTSLTSVYFTGNAPSPTNDSSVFSSDTATVYYLPGTTGWGAMFGGLPTAPWFLPNPLILNNGPGFGVQPGGFGFTISWATNASVVVQAATNLANPVWIPVSTNTLTGGTNYFSDPQWTNYPERFYRVTSTPTFPGFTGNLDLDMYNAAVADGTANGGVPAVMLTENGGPFRVTAVGTYSVEVYFHYSQCVLAIIAGTTSCSSTTFPSGTPVIQFGGPLVCGSGPYGY
jgi:BspA type Leucine rich repeat region (6 copies)